MRMPAIKDIVAARWKHVDRIRCTRGSWYGVWSDGEKKSIIRMKNSHFQSSHWYVTLLMFTAPLIHYKIQKHSDFNFMRIHSGTQMISPHDKRVRCSEFEPSEWSSEVASWNFIEFEFHWNSFFKFPRTYNGCNILVLLPYWVPGSIPSFYFCKNTWHSISENGS